MHNRKLIIERLQFELIRLKYKSEFRSTVKEIPFRNLSEIDKYAIHQKVIHDLIRITDNLRTIIYNTNQKHVEELIKVPIYQMLCLINKSPYQYENIILKLVKFVHCIDNPTEKQEQIIDLIEGEVYATFYTEANYLIELIENMVDDYEEEFPQVKFWSEFPYYISKFEE